MKTIFKKVALLMSAAAGILALGSCTKDFKGFNTSPSLVTEAQAAGDFQYIGGFFPDMQENIFSTIDWEYQVQQNLNADVFSGYEMSADPFGGPNNTNFYMKTGWNSTPFDLINSNIMHDWQQVKERARPQDAHFVAISLILKVEGYHRVTDIYGPMPYSTFGTNAFVANYDSQQAIYTRFFKELDTAVTTLTAYVKANPGAKPFAPFDLIYGGDYTEWLKFANTLRLRLAMRLSYVDAATAQAQAEKAVADPNGLLSTVADDALLNMVDGLSYQNPLWNITNAYGDISMGAVSESILGGYSDPREAKYFLPSTAVPTTEKGIRMGADNATYNYADYSLLNVSSTTPLNIMFASESYFLRAEGALRGWNMGAGTAQSFYNAGVTLSFSERGATMPAGYLTNTTNSAAPYVDTHNAANNIPAGSPYLNNVPTGYLTAGTFEQHLQQIITQKWIAIYPDGQEAWSEYRRTGYPIMFPVAVNNSGGLISSTLGPRRLPFPTDDAVTNSKGQAVGVTELGGPDNGGTKVWWDKNPNH